MNREVLSPYQFTMLTAITISGTAIINLPQILAILTGQDLWIPLAIGIALGVIYACFVSSLAGEAVETGMTSYLIDAVGRFFGYLVLLVVAAWLMFIWVKSFRQVSNMILTALMPETPDWALLALGTVTTLSVAWYGIEGVARTTEIVFPTVLISLIIILVISVPDLDPTNILPLFQTELTNIFRGSFAVMTFFTESLVVFALSGSIRSPRTIRRSVTAAVLIAGLIIMSSSVITLFLFGAEDLGTRSYPLLSLVRYVRIVDFIDRVDPLIISIWLAGVIVKGSVLLLSLVVIVEQVFGIQRRGIVMIGLSLIQAILSFTLIQTNVAIDKLAMGVLPTFAVPVVYSVTVLVWAIRRLRRGRKT